MAERVLAVVVHHSDVAMTARCVASIVRSTMTGGLEIAVVDNAPGDVSALRAAFGCEQGVPVRFVSPGANVGFGAGCNAAIDPALAAGELDFIWLVNPDCVAEPSALDALLLRIRSQPKLGAVASDLGDEPASGVVSLRRGLAAARKTARPDFVSAASLLVRASALREVGTFDPDLFLYWEDVDLCLRLTRGRWGLAVEPTSRVAHARGASVGNRSPLQDYYATRNALLVVRKHAPASLLTAAVCVAFRALAAKLVRGERSRFAASSRGWWDGARGRSGGRATAGFSSPCTPGSGSG